MIELSGTKNTRDLGGYKTFDGKITKRNIFFRSDNTNKLTDYDIKKLREEHNLRTVIDLRNLMEIEEAPDKLTEIEGIKYYNIHFSIPDDEMAKLIKGKIEFHTLYILMLEEKQIIKELFEKVATSSGGAVLFHCTNGKDRTGLLAMILLGLVNVSKEDIVNDYKITYGLIKNKEDVKEGIEKYRLELYQSLPEYITPAIDYIFEKYKNFENYILSCGVSCELVDLVKNRFC
ncbi:MAG: tyrosine-protein phosphatase [Candidatus Paraimprobicoccus trichonymphae]|uniref:Tyrosine-protein phosphatase n=1 Tax=Candidatus Paraimprobicoccus trichonymphae TaxID=3033793 RepID=A0AA48KYX6_9FIRM|nr:MAG: tyrosine-protein phosphatase [Candidatus Paraimprobicoccus trichonymphae]